jgi:hypothetical protein
VYGVAAEVAQEVCMLFQNSRPYAGPSQNEAKNEAGRPAADDAAACAGRRSSHVINLAAADCPAADSP